LVVEREEAIRNFKAVTHYGVELLFQESDSLAESPLAEKILDFANGPNSSPTWKAVWNPLSWLAPGQERFLDKAAAGRIAAIKKVYVRDFEKGLVHRAPPPPFTTSTLQQAASDNLKIDPKKTMELAQKLYEAGHITYMRTDSQAISKEAIDDIRTLANDKNWPVPEKPREFKAKKGAQEAHEAIRPTHFEAEKAGATPDEEALYKLIWRRAVASQLAEATFATAKATLTGTVDEREAIFEAKGRRLVEPGYKVVLGEEKADEAGADDKDKEELDNPVPDLLVGDLKTPLSGHVKTKKTTAPPRYTQAALVRELEKRGIGRPSTYAAILENVMNREYATQDSKRRLAATTLGEEVIRLLKPDFGFVDYDYTKRLEEKLDEIAMGDADYRTVVSQAYEELKAEIEVFRGEKNQTCPACGGQLLHLIRRGEKSYNFWACENQESCGAKFFDQRGQPGAKIPKRELTELKCPECGQPLARLTVEGQNAYVYFKCSDRKNCGASFKDQEGLPGEKTVRNEITDEICPDCGASLRRIVKDGPDGYDFWACSEREICGATFRNEGGRPGAKNVRSELSEHKCPECDAPLRRLLKEGPGGYDFWACSNREKCGATFAPDGDKPGTKTGYSGLSSEKCPDCGQPLRLIAKDGPGGYRFWSCSDRESCGAKFQDQDGHPGDKVGKSVLTTHKCPACGKSLRHLVKEGPEGWDFWGCEDRDSCGATYKDEGGKPGERTAKSSLTNEPCPDCGAPLRHLVKEGEKSFNFWACSDRDHCGGKFEDRDGSPGPRTAKNALTEYKCPNCSSFLRHIVKDGVNGYNFWACSDRVACGATFNDDNGKPGPKNSKGGLSDEKCQSCGSPLRHLVKEGAGGYNFWGCSNQACGSTFRDNDGQPGEKSGQSSLTDRLCSVCGRRLRHIIKEGPGGYNFWGCSDRACGATYPDLDGVPGEKNPPKVPVVLSEYTCLACQSPLIRRVGTSRKTGEDYDFFSCSNRSCEATYRTREDKPVFPPAAESA
jgi:DNA topoisomerase-1